MKLIDKSGYNYLIIEFHFRPSVYIDQFRRWLHVRRVELRMWYNRVKWGRYTGENGRGVYVWRESCWVPMRAINNSLWHTFFDPCSNTYITGMKDIQRIEKEKGLIYADKTEIPREAAKWRARNEKRQHDYIEKKFEKMYHECEQGKSYMKELIDSGRLKKGNYDPKLGDVRS